jgi:hypothetical protein
VPKASRIVDAKPPPKRRVSTAAPAVLTGRCIIVSKPRKRRRYQPEPDDGQPAPEAVREFFARMVRPRPIGC